LALSVPDTGGVSFVPALTGLGAPYWNPDARGLITGITRGTTRAHLARATLESIAFQSADVIEAMCRDAGIGLAELRADGGAAVNAFLMQFQADLLDVPVDVPAVRETTALGAAYLAGLASGFWPDRATLRRQWKLARRYVPGMPAAERATRREAWHRAVALAMQTG
jgi:glycerol kinase